MASSKFNQVAVIKPKLNMSFDPGPWNDPWEVNSRNCFSYALDEVRLAFSWPGTLNRNRWTAGDVNQKLLNDGFLPINRDALNSQLHHIFAYEQHLDHFIRLDGTNTWSHKPGRTKASDRDSYNEIILNPDEAHFEKRVKRKDYNWQFFTIPEDGIKFLPQPIEQTPVSGIPYWL